MAKRPFAQAAAEAVRAPKKPPGPTSTPADAARFNTLSPGTTDLAAIASHRYGLYRTPGKGFSTDGHGPWLSQDTAEALVRAGVCAFDPSGGQHGSIKVTDAGRAEIKRAYDEAPY